MSAQVCSQLLTISHLAWVPTWRKLNLHKLMTSAENQELHYSVIYYSENFCFSDIDDCVNHTCANGGSCVDGISNYSCSCPAGYTGDHCEKGKLAFVLATSLYLGSLRRFRETNMNRDSSSLFFEMRYQLFVRIVHF